MKYIDLNRIYIEKQIDIKERHGVVCSIDKRSYCSLNGLKVDKVNVYRSKTGSISNYIGDIYQYCIGETGECVFYITVCQKSNSKELNIHKVSNDASNIVVYREEVKNDIINSILPMCFQFEAIDDRYLLLSIQYTLWGKESEFSYIYRVIDSNNGDVIFKESDEIISKYQLYRTGLVYSNSEFLVFLEKTRFLKERYDDWHEKVLPSKERMIIFEKNSFINNKALLLNDEIQTFEFKDNVAFDLLSAKRDIVLYTESNFLHNKMSINSYNIKKKTRKYLYECKFNQNKLLHFLGEKAYEIEMLEERLQIKCDNRIIGKIKMVGLKYLVSSSQLGEDLLVVNLFLKKKGVKGVIFDTKGNCFLNNILDDHCLSDSGNEMILY